MAWFKRWGLPLVFIGGGTGMFLFQTVKKEEKQEIKTGWHLDTNSDSNNSLFHGAREHGGEKWKYRWFTKTGASTDLILTRPYEGTNMGIPRTLDLDPEQLLNQELFRETKQEQLTRLLPKTVKH